MKKALAIMLTVLTLFAPLTISAAAFEGSIHWEADVFEEGGEDVPYAYPLKAGDNTVKISLTGQQFAYDFTAEESGVYALSLSIDSDEYSYSAWRSESFEDGTAKGAFAGGTSGEYGDLYYFDKGETEFFCIWAESESGTCTVSLTCLGNVTDVEIAGGKTNYQIGSEVFINLFEDGENQFSNYEGFTFTTDKGLTFTDSAIAFPTEKTELASGENIIPVSAYGIEKELVFNAFNAADYIESISPADGFKAPDLYLDANGNAVDFIIPSEAGKLSCKMTDGSLKTVDIDFEMSDFYLEAEDGTVISLYCDFDFKEDGSVDFVLTDGADFYEVVSEVNVIAERSFFGRIIDAVLGFFAKIIDFFRNLFSAI